MMVKWLTIYATPWNCCWFSSERKKQSAGMGLRSGSRVGVPQFGRDELKRALSLMKNPAPDM